MKQKIFTLGLITTAIVVLGALLKINHWPGGGQLLILGIVMLVLVFLPLALRNHYRTEGNRMHPALYIVTWLTCFVVFGGMLFKVMHWPGAGKALMLALPFPYVVFLPVFLAVTAKDKSFSIYSTIYVLFLLAGISVFSALLSLNVSKEKIDDSMGLSRNYNRLEAVLNELPAPATQSPVVQKIDEVLMIVDDYQSLILATEGTTEEKWNIDTWTLRIPEAHDIASRALIIRGKDPTLDIRLHSSLADLISQLGKSDEYNGLAEAAPAIFDYKDTPDNPMGWTQEKFVIIPCVWSLIYLDGLETDLKLIRAGL
jgi:hypothetical protein